MTGELTSRGRRYLADAARAFERAPVEVTLFVLTAIAFSATMQLDDDDAFRAFLELAAAGALAFAFAWAATLMHAFGQWRTRTRWAVTGAGAVIAALYAMFVADFERMAEAWRAAALIAAAVFALAALPAFAGPRASATERMRLVNGRILLHKIGVLLYGAALFAGLALALAAINTLFELELEGTLYGHIFGWIFFALVPWVLVGGLPDYVRPGDELSQVSSIVHRMSAFLVPPLLAIYYLILYAYAIRIAITGEVPKNLLSPLVIAAGVLASLGLLLFDPRVDSRATLRPLRLTAPLLIAPVLLGIWALLQRLDQYGWTEFRALRFVVLLTFGALAVAATVQFFRRRAFSLHWLPAAFAVVLLLSAIGPWNLFALSRRSQQGRLGDALVEAGFTREGARVRADSVVARDVYETIRSGAQYLYQHHGANALPDALAVHARGGERRYVDFAGILGLRGHPTTDTVRRGFFASLRGGDELPSTDGTRTFYVDFMSRPRQGVVVSDVHATADSVRLLLRVDEERFTADLGALAQRVATMPPDQTQLLPADARVPVTTPDGALRGDLLILQVGLGDSLKVNRLQGILTLRH